MDILVLTISVSIQLNQNTGTDIDKTDTSIYDWTYRHDFIGTYIDKTDMFNYKWTYWFCLYRFPLNQVALTTPQSGALKLK
jgi:hypothetical protein